MYIQIFAEYLTVWLYIINLYFSCRSTLLTFNFNKRKKKKLSRYTLEMKIYAVKYNTPVSLYTIISSISLYICKMTNEAKLTLVSLYTIIIIILYDV